jgi:hypothetical protein
VGIHLWYVGGWHIRERSPNPSLGGAFLVNYRGFKLWGKDDGTTKKNSILHENLSK